RGGPAHLDARGVREDQDGHQVHQGRLAGAVRPDEARDAGRNVQRDAVHAKHLAIELRDLLEHHRGDEGRLVHRITSTGRSLRSMTRPSSRMNTASDTVQAAAPGPSGGSTPNSVHHTRLTAHAGSSTWAHVARKTCSIISVTPVRRKKNARLTAPATTLHFTYTELAIATRLRTSSQRRKPATTP